VFPPDVHAAYVEALRAPGHAHAVCEEYRAAATIDRQHDRADLASGHRIACPILALWSAPGPLGTWYTQEGGPIAIWRRGVTTCEAAPSKLGTTSRRRLQNRPPTLWTSSSAALNERSSRMRGTVVSHKRGTYCQGRHGVRRVALRSDL